jgi:hypothetical protein
MAEEFTTAREEGGLRTACETILLSQPALPTKRLPLRERGFVEPTPPIREASCDRRKQGGVLAWPASRCHQPTGPIPRWSGATKHHDLTSNAAGSSGKITEVKGGQTVVDLRGWSSPKHRCGRQMQAASSPGPASDSPPARQRSQGGRAAVERRLEQRRSSGHTSKTVAAGSSSSASPAYADTPCGGTASARDARRGAGGLRCDALPRSGARSRPSPLSPAKRK